MRKKFNRQMNLFSTVARNKIAQELQQISAVLDATPQVVDLVYQDLVRSCRPTTGQEGMSAEQVLRCAILKQYRQLTYEELAFHLEDSDSVRGFSRLERGQYPSKTILQRNIKTLREETWEAIHREIIGYAKKEKIETGRKVRIDATAVETDIHHPTDSTLLADGVRIITRWLAEGKELTPTPGYGYSDHRRVVKKRVLTILNARKEKTRRNAFRDLLVYAGKVREYALAAIPELFNHQGQSMTDLFAGKVLAEKLTRAVGLLEKVMSQTERRVFKGEQVPASEKVVSFFEEHTDIIVKKRRQTEYGHKVFLTGGTSTLILDCLIERGNPADSAKYETLLDRQEELYGNRCRPMAGLPPRTISPTPKSAGSRKRPLPRSGDCRYSPWPRVPGGIRCFATSGRESRPASPPSNAPSVWTAAPGRGGRGLAATSGVRSSRTTCWCSPGSNWQRPKHRLATSTRKPQGVLCPELRKNGPPNRKGPSAGDGLGENPGYMHLAPSENSRFGMETNQLICADKFNSYDI
jgi:transposase, IS5 family